MELPQFLTLCFGDHIDFFGMNQGIVSFATEIIVMPGIMYHGWQSRPADDVWNEKVLRVIFKTLHHAIKEQSCTRYSLSCIRIAYTVLLPVFIQQDHYPRVGSAIRGPSFESLSGAN